MVPERAVGRQWLCLEHIERGATQRALVKTGKNVGLVLHAAAAGIDQHGRAERAAAAQLFENVAAQDVPGLGCQRQQANKNVGLAQERIKSVRAVEARDAFDLLPRPAPARHAKSQSLQDLRGVGAERAEPHDADRHRTRGMLEFRRPSLCPLRLAQVRLLAVMHQHMQHDVLGHAVGEIGDRHPYQRHVGQRLVRHQRIDAGPEVEDHAQIGKLRKLPRLRLPHRGIVHLGGIEAGGRQQQHPAIAANVVEPGLPTRRRPVFRPAMDEDGEGAFCHS